MFPAPRTGLELERGGGRPRSPRARLAPGLEEHRPPRGGHNAPGGRHEVVGPHHAYFNTRWLLFLLFFIAFFI